MAQQLNINGNTKEEEAISFIREHEPPEGYFLGFSGGKDSTVLKHLAELSGVKFKPYYSATGIDPPEIVQFIKRNHPDVEFVRPKKDFYSLILKNGFPTQTARWCCDKIKKGQTEKIPLKHRLIGLRSEESYKRASRGIIENRKKQILYKPIFRWREYEIWEHIERHKLPYCKLYDEGFDRIGCVVCPFLCYGKQIQLKRNMKRWPGIYRAFERAMEKLYEDREWFRQKVQCRAMLFDEFLDNWYHGK